MDGFIGIDKPAGITSFDVIRKLRVILRERRMGHAGTLDPAATGVLVVAVGRATRLLPDLPTEPKRYEFDIRFGAETDTLDETGELIREGGEVPQQQQLHEVLGRFIGSTEQLPPRYSAVKVDGVRAYRRARNKETFETKPRTVHVGELTLLDYDREQGRAHCRVVCSGGTYVRALARDVAAALGTYGYCAAIRRLAVGRFALEQAVSLESPADAIRGGTLTFREAFDGCPQPRLEKEQVLELSFGRPVKLEIDCGGKPVIAYTRTDELVAVLQLRDDGWYQPVRVFLSASSLVGSDA
ncbi:MAG: tRNA pseudouridine(55) synthase TruB [Chitinivibrionales bacterium]|nr:tRNA pseudouridine(55) synthase TruB [Chitinivibrionales bacterium]